MNLKIYEKRLVLVLKEDDDTGYIYGVFPDITNMVSKNKVKYLLVDVSLIHVCIVCIIIVKHTTLVNCNLWDALETLTFLKSNIIPFRVLDVYAFATNPFIVIIGNEYSKKFNRKN